MSRAVEEIDRALLNEIRWLHGLWRPMDGGLPNKAITTAPVFKPEQVTAMLRIEATHHMIGGIYNFRPMFAELHPREGPMTFRGVALYDVRDLPAPGWRIINPMRKQEKQMPRYERATTGY